jgi:two-component system, NarL family, nitrate/nitrite response regulator NarL
VCRTCEPQTASTRRPERTPQDSQIPASCNAERLVTCQAECVRVLIVDDNERFLHTAGAFLEREGLHVVGMASTSTEAFQRAEELSPDLLLVDIKLGSESGFELTRRLLEDGRSKEPAVILISTHSEADFVDLIAESQAAGFVPKSELSAEAIRRILDSG